MVIALSIGLSILTWFLIIKSLKYARAQSSMYLGGLFCTVLLIGCGILIRVFTQTVPVAPPTTITVNGDCNATNAGSNGKVEANCGNLPPKQGKK